MSLVTALSSIVAGLEVAYEHYRGSYSRRVMYTPVILSAALAGAGFWGFRSRRAAKTVLPAVSALMLADDLAGLYFHIRGIQRKPGGWRLPIANLIMGPPLFAPLLLGISAYLGLVGSFMRRGESDDGSLPRPAQPGHWARLLGGGSHEIISLEQDLREGRFQKHMAAATTLCAFFGGFEALYSHYKNNFRYKELQLSPIVLTPALMAAAGAALKSRRAARTVLPAVSALAMADGAIGFVFHARGVLRRPAGLKKPLYNIMYGPPIFAPLLFAAAGFIGLLASLLRRER